MKLAVLKLHILSTLSTPIIYKSIPSNNTVTAFFYIETVLDLIKPILQEDQGNSADLGFRYGSRNTI